MISMTALPGGPGKELLVMCYAFFAISFAPKNVQDAETVGERLRTVLLRERSQFYSRDQVGELTRSAEGFLSRVHDANRRSKLSRDIERYLVRRADKYTMRWVVPLGGDAGGVKFYRTPAGWELFKYDFEKRLTRAMALGMS